MAENSSVIIESVATNSRTKRLRENLGAAFDMQIHLLTAVVEAAVLSIGFRYKAARLEDELTV